MKRGFGSFREYFRAIDQNPQWFQEFLDRMTINVSEFWRNPNRWELLEKKFLPQMLARTGQLKCWSAACSTGEEPYSLAMILAELGALSRSRIVASDLDEQAIAKARQGIYPERAIRDVPKRYLDKYFTRNDTLYTVSDTIRRSVHFEKLNLLSDSFGTHYDLIICRNVIIYFTEPAKQQLYRKFSASLKPGGILFVGSTEQIFSPEQYGLETAETFFYRKKEA